MTVRVALITGCGKRVGIGASTARALAAQGVRVVVTDVEARGVANVGGAGSTQGDPDQSWRGLDSLVEEIVAKGGTAAAARGDVTAEIDAQRMVEETLSHYGRLDILVNNAGAPHGAERNEIEDVPMAAWDKVMAVNVRGPFLMARAAVVPMRKQKWGRIISLSSMSALAPRRKRVTYASSKAALIGFTKALALDLATTGITVNAVCPGPIKTSRALNTATQENKEDLEAALAKAVGYVPMGRHGTPEEVAGLIAFLASDAGAYITGQAYGINGGAAGSA
jgi:NAD(P)-dependent dehydrogenase (short-subunit alcohol dehydrogenase family)